VNFHGKKILLGIAVLAAFFACSKSQNTSYEDFTLAYAELRIAELEYGGMEDGKILRFQILEKYGFSAKDFENTLEKLKKEPENWMGFQNALIKILDSLANSNKAEGES
jgi:hypothetical protein